MCAVDDDHGDTLLGTVDYSWLFPYAVAMLFRYIIHTYMSNGTQKEGKEREKEMRTLYTYPMYVYDGTCTCNV